MVRDLVNRFLSTTKHQKDNTEITNHTFDEFHRVCSRNANAFGFIRVVNDLKNNGFELLRADIAKTWNLVLLGNEIQRVKIVFTTHIDAN